MGPIQAPGTPDRKCGARLAWSPGHMTQLYVRAVFILFLSPLPPGDPGRVRAAIFLRRSRLLGRLRPRSGVGTYFLLSQWPEGQLGWVSTTNPAFPPTPSLAA